MKSNECVPQRISKLMLVALLLAAATGLIIIGVTILPFFGFILAIPVLALAVYLYTLHLNDQCELDIS